MSETTIENKNKPAVMYQMRLYYALNPDDEAFCIWRSLWYRNQKELIWHITHDNNTPGTVIYLHEMAMAVCVAAHISPYDNTGGHNAYRMSPEYTTIFAKLLRCIEEGASRDEQDIKIDDNLFILIDEK